MLSPTAHAACVGSTLEYLRSAARKPVTHMHAQPGGQPRYTAEYTAMPVTVHDGRSQAEGHSVDREGFALCRWPSALQAFGDRDAIVRRYYSEMEELARFVTGAQRAIVFDHVLRRRTPGTPNPFGARDDARPSAAMRVHCDFTPASAQRRFDLEAQAHGLGAVSRYAILNLWRSTRLPVLDAPLAVCDARTVRATDLVAADIVYPTRTGELFEVLHNPAHVWTYFSEMKFDEVLVFKQYDSDDARARFTPHAAFTHPCTPPDTPPRESIEIRCLLIFD